MVLRCPRQPFIYFVANRENRADTVARQDTDVIV